MQDLLKTDGRAALPDLWRGSLGETWTLKGVNQEAGEWSRGAKFRGAGGRVCMRLFGWSISGDWSRQNKRFCASRARRSLELWKLQRRVRDGVLKGGWAGSEAGAGRGLQPAVNLLGPKGVGYTGQSAEG